MKHLLDIKVINNFIEEVSNNEMRLKAVSNLAVAVLSTLGVLFKFREAIKLIEELKDFFELLERNHEIEHNHETEHDIEIEHDHDYLKLNLIHANFLYQAHKIQSHDPEQNNIAKEKKLTKDILERI